MLSVDARAGDGDSQITVRSPPGSSPAKTQQKQQKRKKAAELTTSAAAAAASATEAPRRKRKKQPSSRKKKRNQDGDVEMGGGKAKQRQDGAEQPRKRRRKKRRKRSGGGASGDDKRVSKSSSSEPSNRRRRIWSRRFHDLPRAAVERVVLFLAHPRAPSSLIRLSTASKTLYTMVHSASPFARQLWAKMFMARWPESPPAAVVQVLKQRNPGLMLTSAVGAVPLCAEQVAFVALFRVQCTVCSTVAATHQYFPSLHGRFCQRCWAQCNPMYLATVGEARKKFLLSDAQLRLLPTASVSSHDGASTERLYLVADLKRKVAEVWGSMRKMEEEKRRQRESASERRARLAEARLASFQKRLAEEGLSWEHVSPPWKYTCQLFADGERRDLTEDKLVELVVSEIRSRVIGSPALSALIQDASPASSLSSFALQSPLQALQSPLVLSSAVPALGMPPVNIGSSGAVAPGAGRSLASSEAAKQQHGQRQRRARQQRQHEQHDSPVSEQPQPEKEA